ncbi:MAG: alanine--tRNA ligase-related protein [bacterium]|nr:alanine--tRNA ligase-related protein [bacterium]
MTLNDVRQKYLDFFAKRGHAVIPSASLVPENDPTTLFTGSGMQPLVPYLLGQQHPAGKRLVNYQKCFRSEDIEEVGDNRHTTFFEMLGNWSLGDPSTGVRAGYWKEEQLTWFFEFVTKEIGISKDKLWVTCFEGDEKFKLPRDTESAKIWEKLGLSKDRIIFYGKKNWWSRAGVPENMPVGEPGGPDSEVFYDFGTPHDTKFGKECHPNCDCGRFMEIGNSVFMEYRRTENPSTGSTSSPQASSGQAGFEKLSTRNVDFGGGLERITAAVNNDPDIFKLDVFSSIIMNLEKTSGKSYIEHPIAFRIIADHTRAAKHLMEDGVMPSNVGQGYVLRRLLRRAILYADKISAKIDESFKDEEEKFRKTLALGFREFEKMAKDGNISGTDASILFTSYGFPFDVIVELAAERGIPVDRVGFEKEFKKHQELSRAGSEKKFKGGLADTSEMSVKYHTATHLLHQALRDVLGTHVGQKGSNITPERLRFDFTHTAKMTPEEIKKVEDIVNEKIKDALPVQKVVLPFAEAEKTGAIHFFGEKYGDQVNVYYIGNSLETAYSKEFCGGPHISNTSVLGKFKIDKEEAVSQGVRRIKAVLL